MKIFTTAGALARLAGLSFVAGLVLGVALFSSSGASSLGGRPDRPGPAGVVATGSGGQGHV